MAVPLRLIDSHTEGEPTRVVVDGGPHLDGATMLERREELRRDWDFLRTAITAEPRASEGTVAAFLTEPVSADAAAGVVFANRAGYLGMCGHGALGVMRTLLHLGRINATNERFALDTPAGPIYATLFDDGSIEIQNVTARAFRLDVPVQVPGTGEIVGDIAYGGNWFFLVDAARAPLPEIAAGNVSRLTSLALEICAALQAHGITGEDGARIDHIEFFGKARLLNANAKNFVLCPDGSYDRSPCGTGTSAKMAVLAARGRLRAGEPWLQESITGTLFTGRMERCADGIVPFIRGRAYVTGETALFFDTGDPFRYGISAQELRGRDS